jgi:hypothetical protein
MALPRLRRKEHTDFFKRVEIMNTMPETSGQRAVYMIRWNLIRIQSLFSIRIHHILLTDMDRDAHDHPWFFFAFIPKGGYWESWGHKGEYWLPQRRRVRWFSFHRCTDLHKIEEFLNGKSSWSLFITGRVVRDWGFHTPTGWVDSDEYIANRDREWWENAISPSLRRP